MYGSFDNELFLYTCQDMKDYVIVCLHLLDLICLFNANSVAYSSADSRVNHNKLSVCPNKV